jgi:hypothetical protein
MKRKPLLIASGLLTFVVGCTTTPVKVSRVPVKAAAHFTLAHFEPSQVDVPAKPTKMVPPPIRIKDADLAAGAFDEYAVVQCIIDPAGIPREVQWVDSSDAAFAHAAVTAITNSLFSPAQKGGKTVAMKMETRIACHLPLGGGQRFDNYSQPTHYTEESSRFSSARDPFDRGTYQR